MVRHHHRHRVRAIWPRCRPVLKSREWPCPRQLRPRRIPMRPRRAWTAVRLSAVWPATACGGQRRCPAGPGATGRRQIARTGLANHMVRHPTIPTSTPRCRPVPPRKASPCLRLTRRPSARHRPRCRNAWRPKVSRHHRGTADRADHAYRRFQLLAAMLQLEWVAHERRSPCAMHCWIRTKRTLAALGGLYLDPLTTARQSRGRLKRFPSVMLQPGPIRTPGTRRHSAVSSTLLTSSSPSIAHCVGSPGTNDR